MQLFLRRCLSGALLGAFALALGGCASKAVISASSTYRDQMADVFTVLDDMIASHTEVWRQRRVLQWAGPPEAIARAAGFDVKMLGTGDGPAPLVDFVCRPVGEETHFAADVMAEYMQGLANASKAPGEGLVAITRAIAAEQKKLAAALKERDPAFPGDYRKHVGECVLLALRIYGSPFAIPLDPSAIKSPVETLRTAGAGAALDVLTAAYDALVLTAQIIEQEKRAEVIQAHVKANRKRVEQAESILSSDTGPALKLTLEDRMRFHLATALVNVANANSASAASVRQESAERAARHIALYRTLAKVDVAGDLLTPMHDANTKFFELVENPRGNFDDFMDALARLRATRDKWVDVRDKYRAWRD